MTTSSLLRSRLHEQLLAGNFHLFAAVCQDVLVAMGCQQVHLAGRLRFKGKNRDGGHDLEALLPGPSLRLAVIQLKQFGPSQRVFRRSVDELRGVALRLGAAEAILITSGPFSQVLQSARPALSQGLLPVRLLDGEELLDLLIARQIGAVEIEERLVFDERYFAHKSLTCIDQGRQESYRDAEDSSHTLTIQVKSAGRVHYRLLT